MKPSEPATIALFGSVCGVDNRRTSEILSKSIGSRPETIVVRRRADLESTSGRSSTRRVLEISGRGRQGGSRLVFVKRSIPRRREGQHYTALKERTDIPRCFGYFVDKEDRELLFLEFVQDRISLQNDSHVKGALDVLSGVNAMDLSRAAHVDDAVQDLIECMNDWPTSLAVIRDHLKDAEVARGRNDQANAVYPRLLEVVDSVKRTVGSMTFLPDHKDPHRFNFGRRQHAGDVVMFDLHGFGYKPRFHGIGTFLDCAASYRSSRSWYRALCEYYLEHFNQKAGSRVTFEEFRNDCATGMKIARLSRLHRRVQTSHRLAPNEPLVTDREWRDIDQLLRLGSAT